MSDQAAKLLKILGAVAGIAAAVVCFQSSGSIGETAMGFISGYLLCWTVLDLPYCMYLTLSGKDESPRSCAYDTRDPGDWQDFGGD